MMWPLLRRDLSAQLMNLSRDLRWRDRTHADGVGTSAPAGTTRLRNMGTKCWRMLPGCVFNRIGGPEQLNDWNSCERSGVERTGIARHENRSSIQQREQIIETS